ncbi:transcription factor SipA3 [Aulographum hederae CBS 113979]|uniref:Transcription factor SipA3 n=1 Tax=Aulographum hederae CBS 113979 TaxID=1176131 RepID=A0A6G1GTA3_9PEZI|nr:transcription factor SipA3 [Aulographum hederae CBS 113979]
MAEDQQQQSLLTPVSRPLSLIPVGLKEAALDSPTFRATAVHFGEQIDIVEKWLDAYVKSATKLAGELVALENAVNTFLSHATPPQQLSEAVLDHDYTILALKKYGEGAREFWSYNLRGMKKVESSVVDPIRTFLYNDLKTLKEARKNLELQQRNFDSIVSRFSSQSKTKEASSLREDAFQLHEARKLYLKCSMDFCILAPQVRSSLDKLLVKIFSDQWREMKASREAVATSFGKSANEMERVRGWSREMENSERLFKRELQNSRKQIEDEAERSARPSRELEEYNASTVPYIGQNPTSAKGPSTGKTGQERFEKQGWLFQRSVAGKPARTIWIRRWFFVKNGIFGWLVQGSRTGAVEESEKIGVLLCGVRPAFQEERRFCFEIKTKDSTLIVQAETQQELMDWISAFDSAKRRALEDPTSTECAGLVGSSTSDAAFAITPPIAAEFAAKTAEGHGGHGSDDLGVDRAATLPVPGSEGGGLATRSSFDVSGRKSVTDRPEGESSSRDTAARLIQKLDLHRKSTTPQPTATSSPMSGGIASLISASHQVMPVGPVPQTQVSLDARSPLNAVMPLSSLAPSTLANPPAPTNLSKSAVILSGERGLTMGRGTPGGLMANLWGSANWGYLNLLERGEVSATASSNTSSLEPSPMTQPVEAPAALGVGYDGHSEGGENSSTSPSGSQSPPVASASHRKTVSLATDALAPKKVAAVDDYPNYYPIQLKAQDAQFRTLFPYVPRKDKLVLVFRATWNPNDQQEFPGRLYVTLKDLYFYSHHLGLVLLTSVAIDTILEVTAAPGKDNDFIFIHFKKPKDDGATRLTIKTFLEPLRLLQRRLDYLVRNCNQGDATLEEAIKTLIKMEVDDSAHSPSAESWEDVSVNTPVDGTTGREFKSNLRIDGNLYRDASGLPISRNATKFRLPTQPVLYTPQGFDHAAVSKEFDVSAKALFHVMFGDKSAVFQILYCQFSAQRLLQSPWVQPEQGHHRRDFKYEVDDGTENLVQTADYQVIDVYNDHLCYVVTDKKTPWHLPSSANFMLVSKVVITHVSKARCKLAIYTRPEWSKVTFGQTLINSAATSTLQTNSENLLAILADQISRLGATPMKSGSSTPSRMNTTSTSTTRRAVAIFGNVGFAPNTSISLTSTDLLQPPPSLTLSISPMTRQTLPSLAINALADFALDALSLLFTGLIATCRGLVGICSAHTLLITLLVLSGLVNFYFEAREGWQSWGERNAVKYMRHLGVGGGDIMVRAVSIGDLDRTVGELGLGVGLAVNATGDHGGGSGGRTACYETFLDVIDDDDSMNPLLPLPVSSSRRMSQRLKRTRRNLAAQRHDLLVAMRVVNRVEREVLQAEWESWVLEESRKCGRVGELIKRKKVNETEVEMEHGKGRDELRRWWEGYCGGCEREIKSLGLSS